MMNFMMMIIEWVLLFTTSINSNLTSAFNIFQLTSRMQQQPMPFQTYFPIDTSMNSCQWKHHLAYTKSFDELVDSRVTEFLNSPLAPSCQRSIEQSNGSIRCNWWEWTPRCTEEFVVPINNRISSFVTWLGKQWKGSPFESLDYHFHENCYDIDDGDYYYYGPAISGAEMLHSYLSFEMYETLLFEPETTITTDYNNVGELASLPKTIKAWLDIAAERVSAYAKVQLLDLLRTSLHYISSSQQKKQPDNIDGSMHNARATKDQSMAFWEKLGLNVTSSYFEGDDWVLAWGLVVLVVALCNVKALQTRLSFGLLALGRVLVRLFGVVDSLFVPGCRIDRPTSRVDRHGRLGLDELLDLTGNNVHDKTSENPPELNQRERDYLEAISKTSPSKHTSLGRAMLREFFKKMSSDLNPAERFVLEDWNPSKLASFEQTILELLIIKCFLYFG